MELQLLSLILYFLLINQVKCEVTAKILLLADELSLSYADTVYGNLTNSSSSGQHGRNLTIIPEIIFYDERQDDNRTSYSKVCQEFSTGVSVVLDFTVQGWSQVRASAETLGVPYMQVEASVGPLLRSVTTFVQTRNVSDVVVIFQNDADLESSMGVVIGQTRLRLIAVNQLSNETSDIIRNASPTPDMFIILADNSNMATIFSAAMENELVTKPRQWILAYMNFPALGSVPDWLKDLPISVYELRPSIRQMCCPLLDLDMGCDCKSVEIVPSFMARLAHFLIDVLSSNDSEQVAPLAVNCDNIGQDEIPNIMRLEKFNRLLGQFLPYHPMLFYDPEARVMSHHVSLDAAMISEYPGIRERLGSWSERAGLVETSGSQFIGAADRQLLKIGLMEAEPWTIYDPNSQQWSGYCLDLAKKIAFDLDVDAIFKAPVQASQGGLGEPKGGKDKGYTDGLIKQLMDKQIDMIVGPLTMTAEREEVLDFIVPYFDTSGISIVVRLPVQVTSLFKFMTVLRTEVWVSVLGALIATAIMIFIIDYSSPYSYRNDPKRYPYPCKDFTIKECFWFTLTSFTPQGGGEAPKSVSARILVAAYWLFVVLILSTFTANLAAYLTVERLQSQVQSLDQLAHQSRVKYAVIKDSPAHNYFRNMHYAEVVMYRAWMLNTFGTNFMNPIVGASTDTADEGGTGTVKTRGEDVSKTRVWHYPVKEQYNIIMDNLQFVETTKEGLQKVIASEEGNFAFIHDAAWIKYEIARSCLLAEVGESFAEQPYALAVWQGHNLSQEISRKILNLQRDRYFEDLSARYWNQSFRAACPLTNDGEGISLESIGGVFIATAFGLVLAILTLGAEILYHRRKVKRREKRTKEMDQAKMKGEGLPDLFREQPPIPQPFVKPQPARKRRTSSALGRQLVTSREQQQNQLNDSKQTGEDRPPPPRVSFIN